MPFTGDTYALPAGSLVSNGDISDASQHNTPLSDIESALTELKGLTSSATLTDNTRDIGTSALRYANAYAVNLKPGAGTVTWTSGAGTPEGVVTAAIGSMFTRTDGGASTTLYVKESGVGNTGWVAK